MKTTKSNLKSAEVFVGNGKFYPIHLRVREIEGIVNNFLELVNCYGREKVKAFFRKDKGGKGIDIRIDVFSTEETEPELMRERRYSFGINANWDVVDLFDHWLFYASDEKGNPEAYTSCEELLLRPDFGIGEILQRRREGDRTPTLNSYLDSDAWVCLTLAVISEV